MAECGKIVYTTKGEAQVNARSLNKRNKRGSGYAYWCEACSGWHVTSGGRGFKGKNGHKKKKRSFYFDSQQITTKKKSEHRDKPLHIKNFTKK